MREPFDTIVPRDRPIDEELGRRLTEWSRGSASIQRLDRDDVRDIETACSDNGITAADVIARVSKTNGWQRLEEIPKHKKGDILAWINSKKKAS
jgi:hypothetical protein